MCTPRIRLATDAPELHINNSVTLRRCRTRLARNDASFMRGQLRRTSLLILALGRDGCVRVIFILGQTRSFALARWPGVDDYGSTYYVTRQI